MARKKTEGRSDLILNSALSLFARYGFAKTTIGDIAKESKIASGTIYLYFKSKDEILRACAQRFHQKHKEYSQTLLRSTQTPQQKLHEYLLDRYTKWEQEVAGAAAGTDLAMAMVSIDPAVTAAEQELWMGTLKAILKEGEKQRLYHFESLSKELKIFLHCLIGHFPLPGVSNPFTLTKRDLLDTIDWFDKKWRYHVQSK